MQYIDVNINHDYLVDNVQENIKILIDKYGPRFIIKDKFVELPAILKYNKLEYNDDKSYYILKYDGPRREQWFIFHAKFIDNRTLEKNNNVYIVNIHKTEEYSGTTIMNTLLKFFKIINVNKVTVHDATTVPCGTQVMSKHDHKLKGKKDFRIDLSFFKLIEKGQTFYQKFGFKFTVGDDSQLKHKYKNDIQLNEVLHTNLRKFKNIKIKYFVDAFLRINDILSAVIKTQEYDKLFIEYMDPSGAYEKSNYNIRAIGFDFIYDFDTLLDIIKRFSKDIYLFELLIKLYYQDCTKYLFVSEFIVKNNIYKVSYKNDIVTLKHILLFSTLHEIKNNSTFELAITN